tara:strand:- start:50 stop:256 length:207 start_codon:yes stop_codon:yes gene_type:complete
MSDELGYYVVDLIKFADGHYEAMLGRDADDEVYFRDATPKEVARQKRIDAGSGAGPVNLPELNKLFGV